MAITPGSRQRGTRTDITGNEDRDTLNTMQEPLGSMDRPGPRSSDINELNLPPGETVRRTGNLGTASDPAATTTTGRSARSGRSFTATFAIAAAVLLAAFLIAIYMGSNRSDIATTGGMQAPVADSATGTSGDTTGSTTAPSQQQTAPGAGDAGGNATGGTGTTTPPANP